MRKDVVAGAAAVGAALIGGAALYYLREKQTEEPDYRALATDGDFQIRDYPRDDGRRDGGRGRARAGAERRLPACSPTISSPNRATARNCR